MDRRHDCREIYIDLFHIHAARCGVARRAAHYGIALGLDYPLALTAAVIGNMIPVPFIIIFIQRVFIWLRRHWPKMDSFITKLEAKAHLKGEKVQKYGPIALLLFVGIPLPGTGAWTGSLIAALLELKPKSAIPCIFLGVLLAAGIMTALTFGVIHVVN